MMKQLIITLCLSTATLVGMAQNEPYRNPNLSPEERAEDLLGRLTLKKR